MIAFNTGLGQAIPVGAAQQYVTTLYQEYLGRQPDPGGFAFWVNTLTSGNLSEAQVTQGFLNSPEYKADVSAGKIAPTGWYQGVVTSSATQPTTPTTQSPSAPSVTTHPTQTVQGGGGTPTGATGSTPVAGAGSSGTSFTATLGLPNLAFDGFTSDEVYIGAGLIGIALIIGFSGGGGRR